MGERVNIQYSVDIDDLGEEVCRLICGAFENLDNINERASTPTNNVMSLQTIKEIDTIRQNLAEVDNRLSDVVNIVNGYISYKSQAIGQQEITSQVDNYDRENGAGAADYESMTESLTNLQERITQFKNENEAANQG